MALPITPQRMPKKAMWTASEYSVSGCVCTVTGIGKLDLRLIDKADIASTIAVRPLHFGNIILVVSCNLLEILI